LRNSFEPSAELHQASSDGITISQLERSRIHNCAQRLLKGAAFITEFQPFWIFPSAVLVAHASSGRQLSGEIMEQ
jgi:hypothetical protein